MLKFKQIKWFIYLRLENASASLRSQWQFTLDSTSELKMSMPENVWQHWSEKPTHVGHRIEPSSDDEDDGLDRNGSSVADPDS